MYLGFGLFFCTVIWQECSPAVLPREWWALGLQSGCFLYRLNIGRCPNKKTINRILIAIFIVPSFNGNYNITFYSFLPYSRFSFMRKMLSFLCFISISAGAISGDIDSVFSALPVDGAIVVSSIDSSKQYVYNKERAQGEYTVASTFKVVNTLIALEEGVVQGKQSPFSWDGKRHKVRRWNQDQTLESAFRVSCVWCYQQIARDVGTKKYAHYLDKLKYGNLPKGVKVDRFWLDGSLKLNAYDQIDFLKKVVSGDPVFGASTYQTLKEIMLVEQTPAYSIYAKTGWSPYGDSPVGWYVGYVESGEDTWFFATNLDAREMRHLPLRKDVTYKVLKLIGAIPNAS